MTNPEVVKSDTTTRPIAQPGWCVTHEELAWRYSDGSLSCWYCCIVETSPEAAGCRVVGAVVIVRGEEKVKRELSQ